MGGSFSRRSTGAISSRLCITPARTAEGEAPVTSTKAQTSPMPVRALLRPPPNKNCISPTRNTTCIPDTATVCISPARLIARARASSS